MIITDDEIQELIDEFKPWSGRQKVGFKTEEGHRRFDKDITTDSGNHFRVFLRQNVREPLDFSIGLVYCNRTTGENIRIFRCNGPFHSHPNKIEKTQIPTTSHVHKATERYINAGKKADSWAYETDEFYDIETALLYFAKVCNISPVPYINKKPSESMGLFD